MALRSRELHARNDDLCSKKTIFNLFIHEWAEDQLLGFLGDLWYDSLLRDSIESCESYGGQSYGVNSKQI